MIVRAHTVAKLPFPRIPRSEKRSCADCGTAIWLAPTSVELLDEFEDWEAVCLACADARSTEQVQLVTPEILRERERARCAPAYN
jgi:hypothetical protein